MNISFDNVADRVLSSPSCHQIPFHLHCPPLTPALLSRGIAILSTGRWYCHHSLFASLVARAFTVAAAHLFFWDTQCRAASSKWRAWWSLKKGWGFQRSQGRTLWSGIVLCRACKLITKLLLSLCVIEDTMWLVSCHSCFWWCCRVSLHSPDS